MGLSVRPPQQARGFANHSFIFLSYVSAITGEVHMQISGNGLGGSVRAATTAQPREATRPSPPPGRDGFEGVMAADALGEAQRSYDEHRIRALDAELKKYEVDKWICEFKKSYYPGEIDRMSEEAKTASRDVRDNLQIEIREFQTDLLAIPDQLKAIEAALEAFLEKNAAALPRIAEYRANTGYSPPVRM